IGETSPVPQLARGSAAPEATPRGSPWPPTQSPTCRTTARCDLEPLTPRRHRRRGRAATCFFAFCAAVAGTAAPRRKHRSASRGAVGPDDRSFTSPSEVPERYSALSLYILTS